MADARPSPSPSPAPGDVRTAVSADGSRIAYERFGTAGPLVILIGGALNDRRGRASGVALARLLVPRLSAVAYDRRDRGDSIAAGPYSVAAEVADVAALIAAEAGAAGSAALFGMSSGAALALAAAGPAAGVRVAKVAVYDPPFTVDAAGAAAAKDYGALLAARLAQGDADGALALFMALVGVPAAAMAAMSKGPAWAALRRLAPTLAHDSAVLDHGNGAAVPVAAVGRIAAPILALAGAASPAVLRQSAERIASAARQGTFRLLPGQTHDVAPEALAPALADFFAA